VAIRYWLVQAHSTLAVYEETRFLLPGRPITTMRRGRDRGAQKSVFMEGQCGAREGQCAVQLLVGFRVGDSLSIHCKLQQSIQEHNFGWGESWESESFVNR
jgi:hypothetical protein